MTRKAKTVGKRKKDELKQTVEYQEKQIQKEREEQEELRQQERKEQEFTESSEGNGYRKKIEF